MAVDTAQLIKNLKKEVAPVYLIAGDEDALIDRALAAITTTVLSDQRSSDFAFTRFEGRNATAAEIEGAVRTVSLFGGRRLVVVRDTQELGAEAQKELLAYVKAPVSAATLVLVVRGGGADSKDPRQAKAAKGAKLFAKAIATGGGVVVDCPRPRPRDLPRLAESLLRENQLRAQRDALYALVEAVGEDLGLLIQAVEKLSLYKGGPAEITAADVAAVVTDTRSESVFALVDAVAEGRLDPALTILRRMLRDGEAVLSLLGQLARHVRNLARVQALSARGLRVEELRAELGLHPFVVQKCLQQSRRFSPRQLARHLAILAELDWSIKRSRLSDALLLERSIVDLCRAIERS
jgi:DNA polymerase-3 subunit delta